MGWIGRGAVGEEVSTGGPEGEEVGKARIHGG